MTTRRRLTRAATCLATATEIDTRWIDHRVCQPDQLDMSLAARRARYDHISTTLASWSDDRLATVLDRSPTVGSGIGGTSILLDIEGIPVFVKRIPLTDLERRPDRFRSTANVFQLPTYYQYGVGSTGFGVWREVAAHELSTSWVLEQECESFPLLYHWRVLEGTPPVTPDPVERVPVSRVVEYWNNSPAVAERIQAIAQAAAGVILLLEYIPRNLHEWLAEQVAHGPEAVEAACAMVEHQLRTGVRCMNERGLLHFDAHFRNILTDGRRLYFADLGLALSSRFELAPDEREFFHTNADHDRCYALTQLVNWVVTTLIGPPDRNEFIRRCAERTDPLDAPAWAAALITRYAPIAAIMNEFYRKLHLESRTTAFPADDIRRVCAAGGFDTLTAAR